MLKSFEQQLHTSQQQSCSSILISSSHETGSDYIKQGSLTSSSYDAESEFINVEASFDSLVVCGEQSISPRENEQFPKLLFDSLSDGHLSGGDPLELILLQDNISLLARRGITSNISANKSYNMYRDGQVFDIGIRARICISACIEVGFVGIRLQPVMS